MDPQTELASKRLNGLVREMAVAAGKLSGQALGNRPSKPAPHVGRNFANARRWLLAGGAVLLLQILALPSLEAQSLLGTWLNPAATPGDYTKIVIGAANGNVTVQMWYTDGHISIPVPGTEYVGISGKDLQGNITKMTVSWAKGMGTVQQIITLLPGLPPNLKLSTRGFNSQTGQYSSFYNDTFRRIPAPPQAPASSGYGDDSAGVQVGK